MGFHSYVLCVSKFLELSGPPVQSLGRLIHTNVMDVAFVETQLSGLSGSDFGIDKWPAVQSKYAKFEWLIRKESERGGVVTQGEKRQRWK